MLRIMAGVVGFEPTHDGFRDRCLTTWRHPNVDIISKKLNLYKFFNFNKTNILLYS